MNLTEDQKNFERRTILAGAMALIEGLRDARYHKAEALAVLRVAVFMMEEFWQRKKPIPQVVEELPELVETIFKMIDSDMEGWVEER